MKKMGTPYGVIMQGQWQLWHHLSFFFTEYKRKIPVYIPVYFLPALIVHRWKLFTKPKLGRSVLYKSMLGTMQVRFTTLDAQTPPFFALRSYSNRRVPTDEAK